MNVESHLEVSKTRESADEGEVRFEGGSKLIHELHASQFATYDDVESETWADCAAELEHLEGPELGEGGEGPVLNEGRAEGRREDASTIPSFFFDQEMPRGS